MFRLLLFLVLALPVSAFAKETFQVLFLGNSYTYFPSAGEDAEPNPEDPYLPKILEQIVESKHPELGFVYASNTPGGYKFKQHYEDPKSTELLKQEHDAVVLQAQSIESYELPKWFRENGFSYHRQFMHYGKALIGMSGTPAERIVLMAHWAYHPDHQFFDPKFEGLRFEDGHKDAGRAWYGETWEEATLLLESNYAKLARKTGANLAAIGRAWLAVKNDERAPLPYDSLFYNAKEDHGHPGYPGSYLAACVLYRVIFGESPEGAAFESTRLTGEQASYLQQLANQN